MGEKYQGVTGTTTDRTVPDTGTRLLGRSPTPGPSCASRDPSVIDRTFYVLAAWEDAKFRYLGPAIIEHTSADFHDLIKGILPMFLITVGVVLTTTLIGAGVGALAVGVGAGPGAVVGFTIGMQFLEVLGVGFLIVYVRDRMTDIVSEFRQGVVLASESCGDRSRRDAASRRIANGIGLFYAAVLQGLLLYFANAAASRTLSTARALIRESKLFSMCEGLEGWITKNFRELYLKHFGTEPPALLPPISQDLAEWKVFVESLNLEVPRDKGALWTKIGAERAEAIASQRGLKTLEMTAKDSGFEAGVKDAFGTDWNAAKPVWSMISEKFARGLSGKVTAFIDDAKFAEAIRKAPAKPIGKLKPGEYAMPDAPVLTTELMEISDVMLTNPDITFVDIRDVSAPDVVIKIMTRDDVLRAAKFVH